MIIKIEPERGGELDGILRVEVSLPMSRKELFDLAFFLNQMGFVDDEDQIGRYMAGEDWQ